MGDDSTSREALRRNIALRLHDRSHDELVAIDRVLLSIERRSDILEDLRERAALRGIAAGTEPFERELVDGRVADAAREFGRSATYTPRATRTPFGIIDGGVSKREHEE